MPRDNYKPISLCDTSQMNENEWLNMRQGKLHNIPCTIGGSEASTVFDLNPWTTSKELYDKKCGITPKIEKEFNQQNKQMGHVFEHYVQEMFVLWFEQNYKINLVICDSIEEFNHVPNGIYNDKHFYQHGAKKNIHGNEVYPESETGMLIYSFAVANVDGLIKINHRIGILEYKTTTNHGAVGKNTIHNWNAGKPPIYYEYQCRHYMSVLNLDYTFLVCAWAFSLQDMAAIYIERDYEIEETIMAGEKEFSTAVIQQKGWENNITDTSNKIKYSHLLANYYTRLYGEVDIAHPPVKLDPAYYPLMEKMLMRSEKKQELKNVLNSMDDEDDRLVCLLAPILQDASYCYCSNGIHTITIDIKTPMSKSNCPEIKNNAAANKVIDTEQLKKDYPDIWKKYQETIFDIRSFKVQNTALFHKYCYPPQPTGENNKYKATLKQ